MSMNEEWKEKWASALESDMYPQTKGHLRDEDGYCCLGVGEDLVNHDEWTNHGDRHFYILGESGVLTTKTMELFGLSEKNPIVQTKDVIRVLDLDSAKAEELKNRYDSSRHEVSLAELNDFGLTFKQIAKVVRELL